MTKTTKSNPPIAVLISDLHFDHGSVALANAALNQALGTAEIHDVPLVIAGDLNDTKAIVRAETMNAIIETLSEAETPVFILEGNHDKINEKGAEHGLNYLRPYAKIIDMPTIVRLGQDEHAMFIPYQNDMDKLRNILNGLPPGSLLIMHQGVQGAHMGDYVVDKTSIEAEALAPFRCFSGHYHRHQTVGTLTYIGNPYTRTFGEANDGPKGFLVLYQDRSFEQVETGLRRHVIMEMSTDEINEVVEDGIYPRPEDKIWLKVRGPYSELQALKKSRLAGIIGHGNFKYDRIYTDAPKSIVVAEKFTNPQLLDMLIDESDESATYKGYLKKVWREIINEAG